MLLVGATMSKYKSDMLPEPGQAAPDLTATISSDDLATIATHEMDGASQQNLNNSQPSGFSGSFEQIVILDERYEILALLGTGGMGNVYHVLDRKLNEEVALKILRPELTDTDIARSRFVEEARLARRVTHHNVVRTFDLGEFEGRLYITMELVKGPSLAAQLKQKKRYSLEELVPLACKICEGLQAAHDVEVVHRDLKPDNILIGPKGRVVLTDFGIASLIARDPESKETNKIIGTPAYLSPEQALGQTQLTPQVDIYALGAVLFELATGVRAWSGDDFMTVVSARLFQPPPDPRSVHSQLPESFAQLVQTCMAREPQGRYASVEEVASALRQINAAPAVRVSASQETALPPAFSLQPSNRDEKSIAVLPFKNVGDADAGYVVEGFVEDLIDTLSLSEQLKVRPWHMVSHHEPQGVSLTEIGKALDVEVLVTGALRKIGDRCQLRIKMISTQDSFQLWGQKYERSSVELLVLVDEMAETIANVLTASPVKEKRAAFSDAILPELYFRARHELRRHWYGDLTPAVELFQHALQLAPDEPVLLSGLAIAQARRRSFSSRLFPNEQPLELARRAVSLAPHLAEPYCAMGFAYYANQELHLAAEWLQRAIARVNTYIEAHDLLGRIYSEIGPVEQAITHLEAAASLGHATFQAENDLARCYIFAGQWEKAEQIFAKWNSQTLEGGGESIKIMTMTRFSYWCRRPDWRPPAQEVEAKFTLGVTLWDTVHPTPAAEQKLQTALEAFWASNPSPRRQLYIQQSQAEVYALRGEEDACLDTVEAAVDHGLRDLMWLQHCPAFSESLRQHPRWMALSLQLLASAPQS